MICCVSCGEEIENGPNGLPNHHCSAKHEGSKRGAETRSELPRIFNQCYADKLSDGWKMLDDDYTGES